MKTKVLLQCQESLLHVSTRFLSCFYLSTDSQPPLRTVGVIGTPQVLCVTSIKLLVHFHYCTCCVSGRISARWRKVTVLWKVLLISYFCTFVTRFSFNIRQNTIFKLWFHLLRAKTLLVVPYPIMWPFEVTWWKLEVSEKASRDCIVRGWVGVSHHLCSMMVVHLWDGHRSPVAFFLSSYDDLCFRSDQIWSDNQIVSLNYRA